MINLILIGWLSLWAASQPADPAFQSDPQAKALLEKTSASFSDLKTLKAELLITIEIPEQKPYERTSEVYLKGQNYRLIMEDEEIICDNKNVWRYLRGVNEVQINDYEPADNEITPTNIFNIYENDFYYLYVGREMLNEADHDVIDLSPMDKSKSYFKVKVWVHPGDHLIHKMKVFDKNGSRYTYAITDLSVNVDLAEDFFTFKEADYPGVWVEDLRF